MAGKEGSSHRTYGEDHDVKDLWVAVGELNQKFERFSTEMRQALTQLAQGPLVNQRPPPDRPREVASGAQTGEPGRHRRQSPPPDPHGSSEGSDEDRQQLPPLRTPALESDTRGDIEEFLMGSFRGNLPTQLSDFNSPSRVGSSVHRNTMGGGGVISTVGKVAGTGAAASRGFRGAQPAPPAEHSPHAMSRNVAAIVSSRSGAASSGDVSQVAVQRPQWEIDDWESDGGESDLVMTFGEPMPRAVFGPAPCFEEAKAATDELKDAVEKVYLSSAGAAGTAIAPPAPNHAVQAFKLLSQSPDARNVVASIVSDSDVYNAVLKNLALMDFFQTQTHKSTFKFPSEDSNMKNSVEDGASGNKVSGLLQHRKHAAEGMVSKVSCLFQHIFGLKADAKTDVAGDK